MLTRTELEADYVVRRQSTAGKTSHHAYNMKTAVLVSRGEFRDRKNHAVFQVYRSPDTWVTALNVFFVRADPISRDLMLRGRKLQFPGAH